MSKKPLCYKVVSMFPDGSYGSVLSTSPVGLKYSIGKKTKPVAGPIFAYHKDSFVSLRYMYLETKEFLEIGKKSVILLCEYTPYPESVCRIVSPFYSLALKKDQYINFWERGELEYVIADANDFFITSRTGSFSELFCFCSWVKPVGIVSLDDIKTELETITH